MPGPYYELQKKKSSQKVNWNLMLFRSYWAQVAKIIGPHLKFIFIEQLFVKFH